VHHRHAADQDYLKVLNQTDQAPSYESVEGYNRQLLCQAFRRSIAGNGKPDRAGLRKTFLP
jgi:hypothetical protein